MNRIGSVAAKKKKLGKGKGLKRNTRVHQMLVENGIKRLLMPKSPKSMHMENFQNSCMICIMKNIDIKILFHFVHKHFELSHYVCQWFEHSFRCLGATKDCKLMHGNGKWEHWKYQITQFLIN